MRRNMPLFAALGLMLVMPGMVHVEAAEADAQQTTIAAEQTDEAAGGHAGDQTDTATDGQNADQPDEAADTSADTGDFHVGELVFAQCEEYINVRSGANTESEVTAKIYNNGSATVLAQEGDWFKIESGNATGYAKAEYFATGAEAEQIAQAVAYNVASVHPEELNIRSGPDETQDAIGVAYHSDELEVVDYSGDWMKVALGNDVYGYVNAYYVDYKTYYPTAETLEEEQVRLAAEQAAAEEPDVASYEEPEYTEPEYMEPEYTETEPEYTEPEYTETEPQYTEPEYTETEPQYTEPEYTETEPQYTEPEYTETEPQYTEPEYTETEPQYTEPEYTETEPQYMEPEYTETEPQYTEPEYTETEPQYTEPEYTETEPQYTETEGSSTSGTGQQIADYAVQFVGNPYAWGGTSLTNGADCSGFAQSVFANFGIGLARVAADQACGGTSVSLDNLQAGDLVFYGSGGIDHVAIYIGGGQIVHAANSNSGIITSSCWYDTPVSARRYW